MSRTDRIIDELQAGGWGQLDSVSAQHHADAANQKDRINREQRLLHQVFTTPDGKEVLDLLVAVTIDKPAWHFDITEPQAIMAYGLHAEGQKSVVQMIINAIAAVDEANRQKQEEDNADE